MAYCTNAQPKPAVFGKSFGSGNRESNYAIATGTDGYFYSTGFYEGPSKFGTFTLTGKGIYYAKHNPQGNILWVKTITSNCPSWYSSPRAIFLDEAKNIYISGLLDCPKLKFSNTDSLVRKRPGDIFISKFDSNGVVKWYRQISKPNGKYFPGNAFADNNGDIIVSDMFSQKLWIEDGLNPPIDSLSTTGLPSFFWVKYNSEGAYLGSNQIDGKGTNFEMNDVSYDTSGSLFIAGEFRDTLRIGGDTLVSKGLGDAFFGSLNLSGNGEVNWLKSIGHIKEDAANGITHDIFGNVYVTGRYLNQLPVGDTILQGYILDNNFFLAKFKAQDGQYLWAKKSENIYGGQGPGNDMVGRALVTDSSGSIYVAGYMGTAGYFDRYYGQAWVSGDMFLVKYDSSGKVKWLRMGHSSDGVHVRDIKIVDQNKVVVGGDFTESVMLDNLIEGVSLTEANSGNYKGDAFVAAWPSDDFNGTLYKANAGYSFSDPEVWYPRIVPGPQDTVIFYRWSHDIPAGNHLNYRKVIVSPGAGINIKPNASLKVKTLINKGEVKVNGVLNVEEENDDE
jgi:hypothetical protein